MVKIAVILSGCGHLDGAEIRESVIALTALDKHGAEVEIFAPDIEQRDVVNHVTGEPTGETRNVLIESARVARGNIKELKEANVDDFDALILPGGYGVAKNLSDIAINGPDGQVLQEFKQLIVDFIKQEKPIGAICISPATLVASVSEYIKPHVTLGPQDPDGLIAGLGGIHQACETKGIVIDDANKIVSTPAYMCDSPLAEVALGIEQLVDAILNNVRSEKEAA